MAHPRHAKLVVRELQFQNAKPAPTPGVKIEPKEDDAELPPAMESKYRQLVARLNFLSQDRCDIQFATKELAKAMSKPFKGDFERLKRISRYLFGSPRYCIHFGFQSMVHAINGMTDSDLANDKMSRKSTSGGCVMLGNHVFKSWSIDQSVIALSSGEAEF